jgi:hypothetical protein
LAINIFSIDVVTYDKMKDIGHSYSLKGDDENILLLVVVATFDLFRKYAK